jgi:hypothetical protein
MSMRAKLIGGVVLAAVALATWKFMTPRVELSFVGTPQPVPGAATTAPPPVKTPKSVAAPAPVPTRQEGLLQSNLAASQLTERRDDPNSLTERTLVGTKWEREGFGLEFGAAGKLLIGGRERANWRVEGQRVRLYRDTTGEEHWLDIVGNKLMWEGQEIGRVR